MTEYKKMKQEVHFSDNIETLMVILNAIPDLLFHLDSQGTFLSFHQGDSSDLVMSSREFIGRNVKDIFDAKLAEQFLQAIGRTLAAGSFGHEYELFVGKQKYYSAKYSKLNENEVIGLVRDISAQKETELALKESEAKYRRLIENINEVIYEIDESGIVMYISPTIEKLTGFLPEEIIGKSFLNFIGVKPGFAAEHMNRLRQDEKMTAEFRVPNKSGVFRWVRFSTRAVFSEGVFKGGIGTLIDITELIGIQEALSNSEQRFREVIEQTQTVVWEVDLNGLYTYVSPVAKPVWGYDPLELVGIKHFYDLHPEKDREEFKKLTLGAFSRKESFSNYMNEIVCRDGRIINVSTNGIPVYDDRNNLTGYRGSDNDITEKIIAGEETARRKNMLHAIAASTEELLSNPDLIKAISNSLPVIGKAVNVDRVYLFQIKYNLGNTMVSSQLLEWNSGTAAPQIDNPDLQDLPLINFDKFLIDLYQKKSFNAILSEMDDGSALKKIMETEEIKSMLIIPVFIQDYFWGYVGYDECKYERVWAEDEISILKSYCNSIASAIERASANEELRTMALFAQENPDPLFRSDLKGHIILRNKTAETIDHLIFENETYTFPEFALKVAREVNPENHVRQYEVESDGKTYRIISLISQNKIHINNYAHNITELKKSQNELERLSLVTSANRQGVHFTSEDSKITYTNEALLRMTGYTRDEVIGRTPRELFNGPLTQFEKLVDGHLKLRPVDTDIIIYRKDKSWFWANIKMQPLDKKEKGEQEYFSVIEDISEKKMAAEILVNSESRLSTLIQNLNEGILLENEQRKIVITNATFCQMFNIPVPPDLLREADCSRSAEESKHFFKHPDEFVVRIDEILSARKPVIAEELELSNGMFYQRDYIPVFINNVYKGHLWKYLDITARKNYERTLKLLEEKYRNIIANMSMGLLETDLDDIIQSANQQFCEMSGYSEKELLGKKSTEVLGAGNFRNMLSEKNQSKAEGISEVYQVQVITKRGDKHWWLTSGAPNFNDAGQMIGTVGISVDITEQKMLEEEIQVARMKAEESAKAKESFLANMSHEIRTPLNAVIGLIREISREPLSPDQTQYIKKADLASQHLLSIVNDILDITKIAAGQLTIDNSPFNLGDVINDAVAVLMPAAREKMIRINTMISPLVAPAYTGDSIRIRQILINIINNSVKFTEKGSVDVECKVTGSTGLAHTLQLSVKDTGIGMDESFVKKVFDKFSQGDLTAARRYGGTGLGMAIIHELVQLMHGTIHVTSKKGTGTTVEVVLTLPVSSEKELQETANPESYEKLKLARVLLVEDNDLNRLVTNNTLSFYNVLVTEAVNGFEAIEKLKNADFDVVLMDLQMPEMDGMEATRIIRDELHKTVPVIALTANAFRAEIERCLAAGMNDYITKPYEESVLLNSILRNLPQISLNKISEENMDNIEKHYNLDNLILLSRGNKEFLRKMIMLFIEQTPLEVDQIKTAWRKKDLDTLGKVAHKIKPNLDNMGIAVLKDDIRSIESIARQGVAAAELDQLIAKLDDVLKIVITELKTEL